MNLWKAFSASLALLTLRLSSLGLRLVRWFYGQSRSHEPFIQSLETPSLVPSLKTEPFDKKPSESQSSNLSEATEDQVSFGTLVCAVCGHQWVSSWLGHYSIATGLECASCGAEAGGLRH